MHPFWIHCEWGTESGVCVCVCVCLRREGQKSLRTPANIAALQIKPVASIAGDTLMSYLLRRERKGWWRQAGEREKNFSAYGVFGCEQQAEGSWLHACVCVVCVCVCVCRYGGQVLAAGGSGWPGYRRRADGQPKLVVTLTFAAKTLIPQRSLLQGGPHRGEGPQNLDGRIRCQPLTTTDMQMDPSQQLTASQNATSSE